jgi:Spy/CpxP family protein refolding chaperone
MGWRRKLGMLNRSLVLRTSLYLIIYLITASASGSSENTMQEGFPPIYFDNGKKIDYGYPLASMALHLKSLTPQQHQEIQKIYDSSKVKMVNIEQQLQSLSQRQKSLNPAVSDSDKGYRSQLHHYRLQLRQQLVEARYQAWLDTKTLLRPEQLQELKQMALDSQANPLPKI